MHRIHRFSLAAACAAAVLAAPAAHACSMAPFPVTRDGVHLVGVPTADTLLAGAGGREYGREGNAADGPIYGQVVHVERLGGAQAAALPPGTGRVVLVPWGYGADCRTTRWSESAVWTQAGERGLFWASLRPREQWVDGVPTLDVGEPYQLPYPQRAHMPADSLMTIDQAFDLLALLPLGEDFDADYEAAHQPLLAWAHANPELARRFPAAEMVGRIAGELRHARVGRLDPPLAGTYRFTLSVDGDAPRTLYARTRSVPHTEWDPAEHTDQWRPPALDDPLSGYVLLFEAAVREDALPADGRDPGREGYFGLLAAPEHGPEGAQVWHGLMVLDFAAVLSADSALVRIQREERERMLRLQDAQEVVEGPEETPARFLLRPDGAVTLEQTRVLGDGRMVVIRGERVSRVALPGAI